MNAKNIKRGFDRLWLVLTAIYLVLGALSIRWVPKRHSVMDTSEYGDLTNTGWVVEPTSLWEILSFCMVPVVVWALWSIGWRAGVWIIRGFKGNP